MKTWREASIGNWAKVLALDVSNADKRHGTDSENKNTAFHPGYSDTFLSHDRKR